MVQMSMVNPSHGKYEHGKSKSCEAYHVKCEFWYKRASPHHHPHFIVHSSVAYCTKPSYSVLYRQFWHKHAELQRGVSALTFRVVLYRQPPIILSPAACCCCWRHACSAAVSHVCSWSWTCTD